MRPLTRIPPAGQPGDYRTFTIASPTDRTVVAACSQVGCEAWRHGWQSVIDEATELGRSQAAYIRGQSRRTFREQKTGAGLTVFIFEPGQRCFAEHRTRPEIYAVRGGDWREQTGPARKHQRPADWVEDFQENQGNLAELRKRG